MSQPYFFNFERWGEPISNREAYWAYYKHLHSTGGRWKLHIGAKSVPQRAVGPGLVSFQLKESAYHEKTLGIVTKYHGYSNPNKGCSPILYHIIVQWQITSNNLSFFYLLGCCWKYK